MVQNFCEVAAMIAINFLGSRGVLLTMAPLLTASNILLSEESTLYKSNE